MQIISLYTGKQQLNFFSFISLNCLQILLYHRLEYHRIQYINIYSITILDNDTF